MFDLKEELKKLPDHPGVYLMHDDQDVIIYIGKAISLKRRVKQYFQAGRNRGPKIESMVTRIARFEYILTDSELEALVLECNLIKEHRPKYNTMLMDDKTYPYIKVTLGEAYPRVLFSRQMKKDKSRYFGPYSSAGAVRDTIELICKIYKLRSCNRVLPRDTGKERACLNYHIHQCTAPCQGYVTKEAYRKQIQGALEFLNGNYGPVLKDLEAKMKESAATLDFEKAAEYRDLLGSVRACAQKQKITAFDEEDRDIMALAMEEGDAVVQVFFVRQGKLIGREHFHMSVGAEDTREAVLSSFIRQYYAGTPFIPREIMLQTKIEDMDVTAQWLSEKRGQKVYLKVPQKGTREKLVELAAENAGIVLQRDKDRIKREERRTIGAAREIASLLGLTQVDRMEAYDISNTNGFESVGSMVVYEQGKPCRSDYRKFKLRTVTGPDDYASMHEVLYRRFTHGMEEQKKHRERGYEQTYGSFTRFPDLILMDGGKGQVNIALQVLDELKLNIPVCGMVKDDHHRTRGLYFENRELPIDTHSDGFALVTRIQDEAHRFAIEYHRSLRSREQVHSVLDDIPYIGKERRKALMRAFPTAEEIRNASVEQLKAVPSMDERAAVSVYTYFHKTEKEEGGPS